MANSVDLVIGKEAIAQVENLIEMLTLVDKQILSVSQSALNASKSISSISTPSGLNNLSTSNAQSDAEMKKLTVTVRDLQNQLQKLAVAKQTVTTQSGNLSSSVAKQTASTREQAIANQILRAETDRNIRANTLLAGSYAKASAQLLVLKKEAKDAAITFGQTSTQAISAAKAAAEMDSRIKSADSTVGDFQRNVGNYSGSITKGLSTIWGGLRKIAYIVPGLGLAGIFGLALNPLMDYINGLDLFKAKVTEATRAKDLLNKSFDESSVQDALKNVEELTINIALAKAGFLDKKKVVDQYNETIGKTTGLVSTLDQAEIEITKNGNAYIQMTLFKAAANLALGEAAKSSLEAEKSRLKSLKEFASVSDEISASAKGTTGLGDAMSVEEYKALQDNKTKAQKKRKDDEIKISTVAAQQNIDIAKKFQEDAAKIAKDFNFNIFGDTKKEKGITTKESEDKLKSIFEANKAELELEIEQRKSILEAQYSNYDEQYKALQQSLALKLMLIRLTYNEEVRLAKGNEDKIRNAKAESEKETLKDTIEYNKKYKTIGEAQNKDRIQEIKDLEAFLKDYHDTKDKKEVISLEIEQRSTKATTDLIDKKIAKIEELKKANEQYIRSFVDEFVSKSGFEGVLHLFDGEDSLFSRMQNGMAFTKESWKSDTVEMLEGVQEMYNFITNASQEHFAQEYDILSNQKTTALKFAGDSAAAKEKIEADYEKKRKQIAEREFKAKQKQAIVNVAIDTAQAIMSLWVKPGFPAAIPMAVAVGALGALQIGVIASQKIPQYFEGGTHTGGMMLVNDAKGSNYKETIVTPDGKIIQPTERNVLMDAPSGTQIFTPEQWHEKELFEIMQGKGIQMTNNYAKSNGLTYEQMDAIIGKHFANITTNTTVLDRNGFQSFSSKQGNVTIINNNRSQGTGFSV
jgi:hypothetical protein